MDKNFDKFVRYQTLLVVWWRETDLGCPYVIFVCQDAEHRRRFVYAADCELTGHLNHGTGEYREERCIARDRVLFALESDIRNAKATAIALPALPPRHEQRTDPASVRHVPLPGLEG